VPNFIRIATWILYLLLIVLGFALVHNNRTDDSVATSTLAVIGVVPVLVGFAVAWGGDAWAGRMDSRPCPRCGRRVPLDSYVCWSCGYDFRAQRAPGT
jgi:protein-S-isoprenylcysteine O-methyltransferase Ste14